MVSKAFFCIVFSLSFLHSNGELKYPVSAIPNHLKEGMYAVVREESFRFEITSIRKSRYSVHEVITILNERGKRYAHSYIFYQKLSKVVSISSTVYDANGEVIKRLKNNEILDYPYASGSLFTDDRFKYIDHSQTRYPYTIEVEYEVEMNYLYSIPDVTICNDDEVSIEKKIYEIVFPSELMPRYRLISMPEPKKEIKGSKEKWTWNFQNVKPAKAEAFSDYSFKPRVLLAPTEFEYDDYKGSMDSWQNYGKWMLQLDEGRDLLNSATKDRAHAITQGLSTTEEKAKAIYEFVQSKTRYVSIQLGIGGLQTFPADIVDKTGFGDCKALSNYTIALLKSVGIKGYYTTILAGKDEPEIVPDFASHQGNHVIVSIPNGKDTLWLECTSQTNPFGYQGNFTGDRWAHMITENGGKLVRTTKLKPEQNRKIQRAEVTLNKEGNGVAKIISSYSGLQYETNHLNFIINNSSEDQKNWILENVAIPNFDLNTFVMKNRKDKVPSAILELTINLKRYASTNGKRVFVQPNLLNRSTYIPTSNDNRKNPVVFKESYMDFDSIRYHVSEELYPEFVPEPINFSSRFGEYEARYTFGQGKLLYTRKVKMVPGTHSADTYNELVEFFKKINKADNLKVVFITKT